MPSQKTRNEKIERNSELTIIGSLFVLSVLITSILAYSFSGIIGNYLPSLTFSLSTPVALSFISAHYICPREISKFDSRILHELAKRKLIEIRQVEDRQISE